MQQRILKGLTDKQAEELLWDWRFWARPSQLAPEGDGWTTWLSLGGRGAGKTRTGSEFIRGEAMTIGRIALVGRDAGDVRDVMIEGTSGILACCPPWFRPDYEPSKKRLTFPNGAIAHIYSAEDPDALRGPQHELAWADEICAWKYPKETWDNLQFGLRLGARPRQIVTTTPRPIPLLKEIVGRKDTVLSRESTYANRANLAPKFFEEVIKRYENTRLGRQELEGEILDDMPGALWNRDILEKLRITGDRAAQFQQPDYRKTFLRRTVIAVDPPAKSNEDSDECGISVCGKGADDHGYVLADLSKGRLTPMAWASRAVEAYHQWDADLLVAEDNQGGEMVKAMILQIDPNVRYKGVSAYRGKGLRAEPVAMKYEQGQVHHVGMFGQLEDQMCAMTVDYDAAKMGSPDRLDACVHALTELMLGRGRMVFG